MVAQPPESSKNKKKKIIDYMTRQEATDYLRISTRTLDNLTKEGAPHYKLGANNSRVLFKYEDLANYVENTELRCRMIWSQFWTHCSGSCLCKSSKIKKLADGLEPTAC